MPEEFRRNPRSQMTFFHIIVISRSFLNVNHYIGRTDSWRAGAHFILPVNIRGRLRGIGGKSGPTIDGAYVITLNDVQQSRNVCLSYMILL